MAAWLSSTEISLHNLLPHIPSICLFAVNSNPRPETRPYSPNSSSQGSPILIPFRLPQISCSTLSLKYFFSDSGSCPAVGIGPLLQFPHQPRVCPVLLTLLFFPLVPLSYWVLHGFIYFFPLVTYFCPLSTGVLHALLCLKEYPDVSVKQGVLHFHLLLCHLVLQFLSLFIQSKIEKDCCDKD